MMRSVLFMSCVLTCLSAVSPDQYLELQISNVEYDKGSIVVALYDHPDTFLKDQGVYKTTVQIHMAGIVRIPITGLQPGEYAVSVFHDVNDNRKLDTNFLGIPSEPVGFSNNARGTFGPPKFTDAKFTVGRQQQVMEITLYGYRKKR